MDLELLLFDYYLEILSKFNTTWKVSVLEFFWSVFSRVWTKYEKILRRIQSESGKIRTRKTVNTNSFYPVQNIWDFLFILNVF